MPSHLSARPDQHWLHRARVPVSLTEGAELEADAEGLALVDIEIRNGLIATLQPAAAEPPANADHLDGGQVWPLFVDMHTHLDKGHIWGRAPNADGSHGTAARTVAADRRAHWRFEDVARRFDFGVRCAVAHGTGALRTHLDSYEIAQAETSWAVFGEQRRQWADHIDLQAVAMARLDAYQGADGARLLDLVAEHGGVAGGILKSEGPLAPALDHLLQGAAERGLDLDLHVDETHDPNAQGLRAVAEAVLRNRFPGTVTCGHCCSLARQSDDDIALTLARVKAAGLAVVTLPMVNLYLQDRGTGGTPHWRGLTLVKELRAAGVPVAAASDNCRDPFFAFGDHDGLEVFREFVRIAQLDPDWAGWFGAVTRTPAAIMGLARRGRLAVGLPADLVLFRGRSMSELLARPQTDRRVLHRGRDIDTALPDYRELDDLIGAVS